MLAPAKVNLFLHVTGKDARGYHLLESLAVQTQFGDVLDVELAVGGTTLCVGGRDIDGAPGDNILIKALSAYNAHFGTRHQLSIDLEKNIPVAAGMGGGSADGAALLRWLAEEDNRPLSAPKLSDVALGIGADVPVCLRPNPQLMRGVGEQLTRISLPPLHMVLANPNRPLSTQAVFHARASESAKPVFTAPLTDVPDHPDIDWIAAQRNDLEPAARKLEPVIGDLLSELMDTDCVFARMSGSGASCFAVYVTAEQAHAAEVELTKRRPGWFFCATRSFGA